MFSGITRGRGQRARRGAPRVTPSRGDTIIEVYFAAEFPKNTGIQSVGR